MDGGQGCPNQQAASRFLGLDVSPFTWWALAWDRTGDAHTISPNSPHVNPNLYTLQEAKQEAVARRLVKEQADSEKQRREEKVAKLEAAASLILQDSEEVVLKEVSVVASTLPPLPFFGLFLF